MVHDPTRYYQDQRVAANYDKERFTTVAGRIFNALEKRNIRKAFSGLQPGAVIVDVPCGTGRLAEALLEGGYDVVGMDISDAMLDVARTRLAHFGERFTTRVADVLDPDFAPAEEYDAALCARVLMHFPLSRQIMFLKNVARLARERVVLTQSLNSPYQAFRRRVKHVLGHQPSVSYPVSEAQLNELLHGAGLLPTRRIRPCPPLTEEIIVVCTRPAT